MRHQPRRSADPHVPTFPRERLYARFDEIATGAVAIVIAGEGLGKSTLIHDYLALRNVAHLRFDAGPEHAVPGELLRGIATAFGTLSPVMARASDSAARALERGDGPAAAVAWTREHLAGIEATIVLDELHHLEGDAQCIALLRALIEATQPSIRWILAVRDGSALPIPRWLASGICELPIESDELRVTPDEICAALAAAGVSNPDKLAASLYERTGGWALALRVAIAAGSADTTLTPERVYDALVDGELRSLSDERCDRIFELAAIGTFDQAILNALDFGSHQAAALATGGLVHPVAGGAQRFYEPYRSRLALRVEAVPSTRRASILDRAAAALEHAGRRRESIALRVRAGDPKRVAAALDRRGFEALDHGEVDAIARAVASIDEAELERHPVTLALKAALASLDESFDVSEAWFRIAIETARDDERREIVIRYGMDLVRRGRDDVVELLETETARGGARENADVDAALWALLGTAYVQVHRLPDARAAAQRAVAALPGVRDDALRARVLHQASYVALSDGDYDAAKALAQRALERANAASLHDLAARALSVLFNVAMLHDDDVFAARDALLRLEEAGCRAGNDGLRLYGILNAYAIAVDAGDVAGLEHLNRQLGEMQVLLTPLVSEALLPAKALRAAWSGRFDHACELLTTGAEEQFDDERSAYRWAEVAVYAAAAGDCATADDAVRSSRISIDRLAADQPLAVRSLAYLALAETLLGNEHAAEATLAEARRATATAHGRIGVLVETVAAFVRCGRDGAHGVLALAESLDALELCGLGGVARFIGRLPTAAIESSDAPLEAAV